MYTKIYKYDMFTLTGTSYDTEVTVKIPRDSDLDAVFDAFQTLVMGLGFGMEGLKDIICERASYYDKERIELHAEENKLIDEILELKKKLADKETLYTINVTQEK
jgi:hypothetical protein